MAKKTTVILVDDVDGTEIEDGSGETVLFALDGVSYEIDLSDRNAKKLRKSLEPWVAAGRRVNRAGRATAQSVPKRNSPSELARAREWLRAQGHEISDRGRVPASLLQDFRTNA